MIGFGELRKLSLQWQTDLAVVERAYALDWLLKGIFDRQVLREALALRGGSALSKAFFVDFPQPEDIDLARGVMPQGAELEHELAEAALDAAHRSGLTFKVQSSSSTLARFEFTGPLGRRSAAQPHLLLHLYSSPPRARPLVRPLLHPFSDHCEAMVRTVSLEELAAERIAALGYKPRARDVYDLWFILTHSDNLLNRAETKRLAQRIAAEKGAELRLRLNPEYRPLLERAWENALKMRSRPPLAQAEAEIKAILEGL